LGMAVRSSLAGATNIRKILSTTNQRNKRQTDMRNEGLPSRMPGIAIRAFAGRVRVRQSTLLAGLNSRCATLGGQQPVVSAGHCLLEWTKCRLILAEKRPRILPRSGGHWFKGRDAFTTRLGPSPNQVLQDPAKSPALCPSNEGCWREPGWYQLRGKIQEIPFVRRAKTNSEPLGVRRGTSSRYRAQTDEQGGD